VIGIEIGRLFGGNTTQESLIGLICERAHEEEEDRWNGGAVRCAGNLSQRTHIHIRVYVSECVSE